MQDALKFLLGLGGAALFGLGIILLAIELSKYAGSLLPSAVLFVVVGILLLAYSMYNSNKKRK